jgi:small subunit ribosomal protein S13
MPIRISGVEIPENKQIKYALTNIKGIGTSVSSDILDQANIKPDKEAKKLDEKELKRIREIIENKYKTEGDLKLEVNQNIRRLKDINSYVGDRHKKNLPVKGQRTKTNARTKRGRRVTVGSGRKPAAEKT